MAENLQREDVETLIFFQIWLLKKISFAAHPPSTFVSNWLGNYNFYANADQGNKVLSTLQDTLMDQNSIIGKELHKLPLHHATSIINSARIRAYHVSKNDNETHWAFYTDTPYPNNIELHHNWVDA